MSLISPLRTSILALAVLGSSTWLHAQPSQRFSDAENIVIRINGEFVEWTNGSEDFSSKMNFQTEFKPGKNELFFVCDPCLFSHDSPGYSRQKLEIYWNGKVGIEKRELFPASGDSAASPPSQGSVIVSDHRSFVLGDFRENYVSGLAIFQEFFTVEGIPVSAILTGASGLGDTFEKTVEEKPDGTIIISFHNSCELIVVEGTKGPDYRVRRVSELFGLCSPNGNTLEIIYDFEEFKPEFMYLPSVVRRTLLRSGSVQSKAVTRITGLEVSDNSGADLFDPYFVKSGWRIIDKVNGVFSVANEDENVFLETVKSVDFGERSDD
mgnify:CR=1 FL=1